MKTLHASGPLILYFPIEIFSSNQIGPVPGKGKGYWLFWILPKPWWRLFKCSFFVFCTRLKQEIAWGRYISFLTCGDRLFVTYADGNTCFYGKCFYCRPEEAACAQGDIMEGSVTLWLPEWYTLKTWRHPYQRTYRPGMKAQWGVELACS